MDELDRMYRRLVQNIRTAFPDYLARPFEVAELYQTIIPYRHNRRELDLETNQDYELTLLRLLSGERGYLSGDVEMQESLRRELASPNPDLSAFRGYATSQVALAGDGARGQAASSPQALEEQRPSAPARVAAPAASPAPAPAAPPQPVKNVAPASKTPAGSTPTSCRYCGGALPEGRKVTFCPHCGQNLSVRHCPACGTELEVTWRFCTTCGREVGAGGL